MVGYGCTTCIGNSGPVAEEIANAVKDHNLVVSAVLSGNRNFEGRINPVVRANYLASPPLVVAFALAGTVDIDLRYEPLGHRHRTASRSTWPISGRASRRFRQVLGASLNAEMFREQYGNVFNGNEQWNAIPVAERRPVCLERRLDLYPEPALLHGHDPRGAAAALDRGRARAGAAGR